MPDAVKTIPLELTDSQIVLITRAAHELDITLNQFFINAVMSSALKILLDENDKLKRDVERLENLLADELVEVEKTEADVNEHINKGNPVDLSDAGVLLTRQEANKIAGGLRAAFSWNESFEGRKFWADLVDRLES